MLFGLFQANGKVYNAEIAHKDLRGSLGTVISNMYCLGSLYTYITGYFIHRSVSSFDKESFLLHLSSWRTVAWLQLLPCALLGVSVYFVPNSPYW